VRLPGPQDGRAVTEVERDGRRIAAVVHDPTLLDDPDEVRAAGAAAALSLENERLEAELRAKVEQLSASRVRVRRDDGEVTVELSDDGVGGADPTTGSGLRGLVDRVSAVEGRLDVDSEHGQGTTVRATIPCDAIG